MSRARISEEINKETPAAARPLQFLRRYWFTTLVAVFLFYILAVRVDYKEFITAFVEVSWLYILLAVVMNLVSIMLKVCCWKIIFDFSFKGIRSRWTDLTSALMIGFLVNAMVPARLGEIARGLVISRRQSLRGKPVSRSTVFGTIVLERVFDGVVMGLIVIYGIVNVELPAWAAKGSMILLVISLFFAMALIVLEIKRKSLQEGSKAADARHRDYHPLWKKMMTRLYGIVARFSEGQRVLRSPLRVIAILCTTMASWLAQMTAVYFSLMAFHLDQAGIMGALLLLILINVAGALPATPANVGIFQLATVIPLSVTYGISEATALAFSIGLQVIEGSIGVGAGSAFLLREGMTFGQVKNESRKELGDFASGGG